MIKTAIAYLRLLRPPNLVTAVADIAAGVAVAISICGNETWSHFTLLSLLRLSFSTVCLYGGGVVMNDVADFETDQTERPERPIPSGNASRGGAAVFGIFLLIAGFGFAWQVSQLSAYIAASIAVLALLYDYLAKQDDFFGPLNMGLCRGANLLLGMSACAESLKSHYLLAIIPIIYIAAITMISRGEVTGGNKKAIQYASLMYAVVIGLLAFIAINTAANFYPALVFLALFTFLIYRPLMHAYHNNEPGNIRKAVKAGVISIIALDAALAACFVGWQYGLAVLLLLPFSVLLARVFAVT